MTEALAGRRILVVEDNYLVALGLAETLRDLGAQVVGPVGTVDDALDLAGRDSLDGAVLDVRLNGEMIFPVADRLLARGIPILLLSAASRSDLPDRFGGVTLLRKPAPPDALRQALEGTFATG